MYLRTLVSVAAASTLAACTFNANMPKADPALNAEAQTNYADLVAGRDEAILARLSANAQPAVVKAQFPMLRTMIGDAPAPEPNIVSAQSVTGNEGHFYNVAQDYAYPDRVAHVQTSFVKEGEGWKIQSFNVNVTMNAAPTT